MAAGCSGRVCPEPMDFALKEAIRCSLQDFNEAPPKAGSCGGERRPSPLPRIQDTNLEKPKTAAPVAFEVNIVEPLSNASLSFNAFGSGTLAEVLRKTLDPCANVIDAMVKEIKGAYFTGNTATSADAEVKQADDESTGVISVDDFIEEEAKIAIKTVSEDDNNADNRPESVAEATDDSPTAGATILEPINPEGENRSPSDLVKMEGNKRQASE